MGWQRNNDAEARHALAEYYRGRKMKTWLPDPSHLDLSDKERTEAAEWSRELLAHEVLSEYWNFGHKLLLTI